MKKRFAWILILACVLLLCACETVTPADTTVPVTVPTIRPGDPTNETEANPTGSEIPVTTEPTLSSPPDQQEERIETPYAVITAPAMYDRMVRHEVTSEDPYTLTFISDADDTEIFSMVFNGDGEGLSLLGTLIGAHDNTVIYMNVPTLDQDSKYYTANAAYQEEMSYIIAQLNAEYDFAQNQIIPAENPETMEIKTDVLTLRYPIKWKDQVTADVSADGVRFRAGDTALFDILFGEDAEGSWIGSYNGTKISVLLHDVDRSLYTEEEYSQFMQMQEDANVLLDWMEEDELFVHR